MGASSSSMETMSGLRVEELEDLQALTGFDRDTLETLYTRFRTLDRADAGMLAEGDLERIPEVAMNPMVETIKGLFGFGPKASLCAPYTTANGPSFDPKSNQPKRAMNFRDFVFALSLFQQRSKDEVMENLFEAFADREDRLIKKPQFIALVRDLVGKEESSMSQEDVEALVDRAMTEMNCPNGLALADFCRAIEGTDVDQKLTIRDAHALRR